MVQDQSLLSVWWTTPSKKALEMLAWLSLGDFRKSWYEVAWRKIGICDTWDDVGFGILHFHYFLGPVMNKEYESMGEMGRNSAQH